MVVLGGRAVSYKRGEGGWELHLRAASRVSSPVSGSVSERQVSCPRSPGDRVALGVRERGSQSEGGWGNNYFRNVKRFRGGLVFKAHRLVYHSSSNKDEEERRLGRTPLRWVPRLASCLRETGLLSPICLLFPFSERPNDAGFPPQPLNPAPCTLTPQP